MNMPSWQRAVVKVGSALIAPDNTGTSSKYLLAIARFIIECRERGQEVVLVSSGSAAAGRTHIAYDGHPIPVPIKKAMAAVGQPDMMANWSRFFDFPCAQILITHGDLRDRARYVSVRNTMHTLLEHDVLPVVNENDALATDEMKVGDNDNLAAMIATLVDADALFICSDIDGLFDADPRVKPDAKKMPIVEEITEDIFALAGGTTNKIATGGMRTKIEAAEKATSHGIDTYIVNGSKGETFELLLQGQNPGTLFKRQQDPMSNKKHWLRHTLVSQGEVVVDSETADAVVAGDALTTTGIVDVQGDFNRGDAVVIRNGENTEAVAKGICQYSSHELLHIKGQEVSSIAEQYGYSPITEVIESNDLTILEDE
ncbi:glutamate 5-kinase [Pseudidiomarina sediminum]|uniref:Glutamate 5-kinase n=1 Tax=Pseudidiomarina sediminum TaxID=431675 RepID=A0A432Z386_9GAMM|nr:glutamate 5-kinase [Pseudidiomarina sediminum]MBY6064640.1 glutamate 5-kinase [Pseudidiomarina sediminum]RUO72337.1 glutamate 5-kinase [Pseudidiomarina sediminum]